jgi:membrane-bound lytic murein transglycosylase D
MTRRIPCTLAGAWLALLQAQALAASNAVAAGFSMPAGAVLTPDEEGTKLRLEMMCSPVPAVFDDDVKAYLARYLTYGVQETQAMLGRGIVYLPIIEHYLERHGLPEQLKYLTIVESEMVPYSVSTRGAAGLWQLVPATGRALGLVVDGKLDERKDPNRSTEAATKYLKRLHRRFGNWELALVAYNCGPARLARAIQQAGSSEYHRVKPYLPKETQLYIARFLAATYIGTFFQQHNIVPAMPDPTRYAAMSARVYEAISLKKINQLTGVDMSTLRRLNPAFLGDYVPPQENGVFLTLPKHAWERYLKAIHSPTLRP